MSDTSQPLQQEQPPPLAVTQQAYSTHTDHGSAGALIVVLAVIAILGVIAGMIGRLCSGRTVMGYGHYDFEGWVETKCSSCIDGRIDPPLPQQPPPTDDHDSIPAAVPIDIPEEANQTDHSSHSSPPNPPATTS